MTAKRISLKTEAIKICEKIEEWLDDKDITIPNDERDEYFDEADYFLDDEDEYDDLECEEELCRLFGSDYYAIEDFCIDELEKCFVKKASEHNFDLKQCDPYMKSGVQSIIEYLQSFIENEPYTKEDLKDLGESIYETFFVLRETVATSKYKIEFETDFLDMEDEYEEEY